MPAAASGNPAVAIVEILSELLFARAVPRSSLRSAEERPLRICEPRAESPVLVNDDSRDRDREHENAEGRFA